MQQPALQPGAVIDGFTLVEALHQGGMANLWRVTHEAHDGRLLMKVPRLAAGDDPAAIVSFEMEMMILPRLKGEHVPRHVASGSLDTQPFLVMEEIAGKTLLPRLKELPLEAEEVADIGARVATALDSLHRQNVIHLDLKPSNIMFRANGEAVLLDFGLSHHTDLPDLMKEEFRLPYGTAPYMAPEQVLGVRNYRRSDVFALGVLLYFFATAVRPFGDPQTLNGLKERLWRDPQPPRHWRKAIPLWLQEVILHCLEPDPQKRYPTAAQVAFDLRHPDQIKLTGRSQKTHQDGWWATMKRKHNQDTYAPARKLATQSQINSSPIVAVAIDLREPSDRLADALRAQVQLAIASNPNCRLACVSVVHPDIAIENRSVNPSTSSHINRLVALQHWARPMGLGEGAATFHVIESSNPAEAILDYARTNHVDHIIMGARAESLRRSVLGSVSAQVAAHAPCTVSVVRQRVWPEADPTG